MNIPRIFKIKSFFFGLFLSVCAAPCFAQSKTTTYTYDALGRLTFIEDSQNGNRDYDYDKAGNRLLVSTNTSNDSSAFPVSLASPTNLSMSHIADCAWRANWSTVSGATSYQFAETNGTTREVTTTQTTVSCPRGNPNGNKPKSVRACNLSMGCGYPSYF